MYVYDDIDKQLLTDRVEQFRGQTLRYLAGELTDDEFLPLRLQNGLYIQRLAPMLRISIPYGMLSSRQLRTLAHVTRHYDKGYGHVSTRQNMQLNWPRLEDVPDILAELATVNMHAIQTSGNCIRNVTTDQFAGAAPDEIEDPRPWCEIIRQWATFHPEFAYLPRKFKIAVCASEADRAAIHVHDIGVELVRNDEGVTGFRVLVGGGLGRTPVVAPVIGEFVPAEHILTFLEAILRIYNQYGFRDNRWKARIKILVRAMGVEKFRELAEAEWQHLKDGPHTLTREWIDKVKDDFTPPPYQQLDDRLEQAALDERRAADKGFDNWVRRNVLAHKQPGYAIVTLSTKRTGVSPGDITDAQMEAIANLADACSFGEVRTTHEQNLVLADVRKADLPVLYEQARKLGLATPNIGFLTDIICCPGGDYCSLANAKSIPVAEAIQRRFDDLDFVYDLGKIDINISGCMNACGHHHVGHIGVLGVDKKGEEFYQISLGGNAGKDASLGKIIGPSFRQDDVPEVIARILETYAAERTEEENFIDTFRRVGLEPFKERVYATTH